MKYKMLLIWVCFGCKGLLTYGQEPLKVLQTDTIQFYHHQLIISYPQQFNRSEKNITYGGKAYTFSAKPPISFITVMESTNTRRDFGENCSVTFKGESEDRYTERGVCLLKGYYRVDYFKRARISVSYEVVSECELSFFDLVLDSVVVSELSYR